MGCCGSSPEA
jgi:hypothetical protein